MRKFSFFFVTFDFAKEIIAQYIKDIINRRGREDNIWIKSTEIQLAGRELKKEIFFTAREYKISIIKRTTDRIINSGLFIKSKKD